MKNKIHILIFIAVLTVMSCSQNSYEKELNGKWYGLENDGYTRFFFYPDSLIITELGSQNVQWTANNATIEYNYNLRFGPSANSIKKFKTAYILSKSKDTLFCKIKDSTEEISFSLMRADNYLNFLSKKNEVDFELPSNTKIEHFDLDGNYGFKIFIGTKNGTLKIMTEYGNGLDSIQSDILKFKQNINPQEEYEKRILNYKIHFRVFADKSISNEKLNSYIQELDGGEINRVYRIYKSEEYENLRYLRGERINTNANISYIK
ncbi:hypothetical protein M4I21_16745 [Cellulophaga sp. 20_2_10]|uniref:hypothetical protein n=1 Tax=Cellulophaga sp. 20_2_10 TaxID=2942476 RepID=UPI00201A2516|nr:hypothetical protein [Cellulophaga sp. 20_2_10]MCL5247471.1 hypothetical protein [Cellulophaga sp. 20_2_10]